MATQTIGYANATTDTIGATTTTAMPLSGQSYSSTIDSIGDQDWFRVTLNAGTQYTIALDAASGSRLDPYLRLLDASGVQRAYNDDAVGLNSRLTFTPTTTGVYYFSAQGYGYSATTSVGAYRLSYTGTPAAVTPDLIVSAPMISGTLRAGAAVMLSEVTYNVGAAAAPASATKLYLSRDTVVDASDVVLATVNVVPLARGQYQSNTLSAILPGDASGSYYLLAKADANSAVTESNEANNVAGRLISVVPAPTPTQPDLVAGVPSVTGTPVAGGSVTLSVTTSNLGAGAAAASTTKLYLSTDATVDAGDTVLATFGVGSLARAQSQTNSLQVTLPGGLNGSYYLLAKADANSAVTESNETNNVSSRTITIPPQATDTIPGSTSTTATLTAGQTASSAIETAGDQDWFRVQLTAGTQYAIALDAASGSGLNSYLRVLDASGVPLAYNDDGAGVGTNSRLTFTPTASGTYYFSAQGSGTSTGAYTLSYTASGGGGSGGFNIAVDYTGSSAYLPYVNAAVQRWQQVITGDLPDAASSPWGAIDDVKVAITIAPIDGAGNILGYAGYDAIRSGSTGLPYHGGITLDSADVGTYTSLLTTIIEHEMGHILGVGTLWDSRGLTDGAYGYTGANALAEYRTLAGNSTLTSIPLENTGGSGTARAHWRETTFGNEIMTGWIDNGSNPLSRMTIASLKDLGYAVNMNQADPYTLPAASRVAGPSAAGVRSVASRGDLWVNSLGAGALSMSSMDVLYAPQSSAVNAGDARRGRGLLAHA